MRTQASRGRRHGRIRRIAASAILTGAALLGANSPTLATEATPSTDAGETISLRYRTLRNWDLNLPAPQMNPVASGIDLTRTLGARFGAALEGTTLRLDSDADGASDVSAAESGAIVTLRGDKANARFKYAVRLVDKQGWHYMSAGVLEGRLGKTKIRLIDQNNNGSFGDIGVDAMIVGRSRYASFLSEVINAGGDLYQIKVDSVKRQLHVAPYQEKSGTFSLAELETKAKVLSAIVKSADGRFSFNLANAAQGMKIPAGSYAVVTGALGIGEQRVSFETGRSRMLKVRAAEKTSMNWGGPVQAEFAYRRQGDQLHLSPDAVWYYGKAGELYHGWNPIGKSPRFVVRALKTGREIAEAYFPGTC